MDNLYHGICIIHESCNRTVSNPENKETDLDLHRFDESRTENKQAFLLANRGTALHMSLNHGIGNDIFRNIEIKGPYLQNLLQIMLPSIYTMPYCSTWNFITTTSDNLKKIVHYHNAIRQNIILDEIILLLFL